MVMDPGFRHAGVPTHHLRIYFKLRKGPTEIVVTLPITGALATGMGSSISEWPSSTSTATHNNTVC